MAADDRAFTYDLTTSRGKIRLRLTDTRSPGTFSDDEIDYFLTEGGSVVGGAIEGLKVLLVDSARRTRLYSKEGMSYNDTAQVAGIQAALRELERSGGYPSATVNLPHPLPMDAGWDSTDP